MSETSLDQTRREAIEAAREFGRGNPVPFKEVYSHGQDATLLGAFGGFDRGWSEIGPRLDWAASQFSGRTSYEQEDLSVVAGTDLAYAVTIERSRGQVGGSAEETVQELRVTQISRREDGRWRLVHRHADPLVQKRPPQRKAAPNPGTD
jgi:ketosteroid isomerase-like protein